MSEVIVNTKGENGEDLVLVLKSPTASQLQDAKIASGKAFQAALSNKFLLREKLLEQLREQGIWDDAKENELKEVTHQLSEGERRLARGAAAGFKKSDAKKLAIDMRRLRIKQAELLAKTRSGDEYTVEAFAENAHFDSLISSCTFYDDNRQVFKNVDDYRGKASLQYAIDAATNLAKLIHNYNDNWEKELPENKFLVKYGFVNEKLMFVNKDGKITDENGLLINEEGRYINEANELVDRDGNRVDEEGKPLEEFVEFTDD